jgi:hypothetical protein
MKRLLICVLALSALVVIIAVAPTHAGDDEAKKKLEQIRKELDDLKKKEKDLAKERDEVIQKEKNLAKQREDLQKQIDAVQREAHRRAEELRMKKEIARKAFDEADKKKHYAKIELRGKLINPKGAPAFSRVLFVLTNENVWPLQFGDDKQELQKSATKLIDEPVVVTGTISTTKRNQPYIYPAIPDEISPFPRPIRDPRIIPGIPYGIPMLELQLPLNVESIRLFEEK